MGMRSSLQSIRAVFRAEPVLWALAAIFRAARTRVRGAALSRLFRRKRVMIGPRSRIYGVKHITIGEDFFALEGLWLEAVVRYRNQAFNPLIHIGDRVSMSGNVHITCINRIDIGNSVLFGSKVYVSDHNHGRYSGGDQSPPGMPPADRPLCSGGPVVIEDCVWIGDNVVIVGPVKIGFGAIVAANSVVLGDVSPSTIVGGIPARPLKRFNAESQSWEKA